MGAPTHCRGTPGRTAQTASSQLELTAQCRNSVSPAPQLACSSGHTCTPEPTPTPGCNSSNRSLSKTDSAHCGPPSVPRIKQAHRNARQTLPRNSRDVEAPNANSEQWHALQTSTPMHQAQILDFWPLQQHHETAICNVKQARARANTRVHASTSSRSTLHAVSARAGDDTLDLPLSA